VHHIEDFLHDRLRLELHPDKVVLQHWAQGIDFLGSIVHPDHRLTRQRSVRALRRRLHFFMDLLDAKKPAPAASRLAGTWKRWLADHDIWSAPGIPSAALLQRMLSTINSYYGLFVHADTYRLRKHIYERELGPLRGFFLPADKNYGHLVIRKCWRLPAPR